MGHPSAPLPYHSTRAAACGFSMPVERLPCSDNSRSDSEELASRVHQRVILIVKHLSGWKAQSHTLPQSTCHESYPSFCPTPPLCQPSHRVCPRSRARQFNKGRPAWAHPGPWENITSPHTAALQDIYCRSRQQGQPGSLWLTDSNINEQWDSWALAGESPAKVKPLMPFLGVRANGRRLAVRSPSSVTGRLPKAHFACDQERTDNPPLPFSRRIRKEEKREERKEKFFPRCAPGGRNRAERGPLGVAVHLQHACVKAHCTGWKNNN
ncbi:hypothetical protein SKAU_G00218540 [Synaphobranchus kaupii]|uniref:Uncharacterized protein n=1 Tax=Synaphobranchus kaupii TaxID=118154 RepID=A0A9Q1IUR8_SYNKA|nr:hypothetical protein SKAU_G00218540 [Synaphobranchus kaupii]